MIRGGVSEYLETADEVKLLTPDKLEGEEACPASAILSFLKLRESGDPKLPLFVDKGGRAVCPERFNDKLKELMGVIEPSLKGRFTSKSFQNWDHFGRLRARSGRGRYR